MKVLSRRPKGKFVFLNRCLPWDDLPFVNDKKNEGPNLHEAKIVLIKNLKKKILLLSYKPNVIFED